MKLPRTRALLCFALCTAAALAACGGGGGGGTVTPPANSGDPSSGTTGSPTPSTSPTPTPTPTPTATPLSTSSSTLYLYEGVVLGDQSWYTSGTSSWSNHSGGTSTAPTTTMDGMTCTQTQEPSPTQTTYGQHAFVGILYNGAIESLPQAIGMVNPKPPTTPYAGNPQGHKSNTDAVEVEDCEFNVHTHDFSGLVHVEDATQPQSTTAILPYANLQTLFDVWGAQLTADGITAGSNSLNGPVQIYTGAATARYTPPGNTKSVDLVNSFSLVTGPASSVPLYHHNATWIVIGQPPANGLPQIAFGVNN